MGIYFMFGGPVYFFCGAKFQIVISRLLINIFDSKNMGLKVINPIQAGLLRGAGGWRGADSAPLLESFPLICYAEIL